MGSKLLLSVSSNFFGPVNIFMVTFLENIFLGRTTKGKVIIRRVERPAPKEFRVRLGVT